MPEHDKCPFVEPPAYFTLGAAEIHKRNQDLSLFVLFLSSSLPVSSVYATDRSPETKSNLSGPYCHWAVGNWSNENNAQEPSSALVPAYTCCNAPRPQGSRAHSFSRRGRNRSIAATEFPLVPLAW